MIAQHLKICEMSVGISRAVLTEKHIKDFVTLLTVTSKDQNGEEKVVEAYDVNRSTGNVHMAFYFGRIFAHMNKLPIATHRADYPTVNLTYMGTLRDYQVNAMVEIREHLNTYRTSTVAHHPGAGKTRVGGAICVMIGLRALILLHREILIKQWIKSLTTTTNAKIHVVGSYVCDIPGVTLYPEEEAEIIICMDQRVDKLQQKTLESIGIVLIDEAHCFCTPTRVRSILKFTPRYLVALTATPDREDGLDVVLQVLVGTHRSEKAFCLPFSVTVVHTGVVPERQYDNIRGKSKLKYNIFTQSLHNSEIRNLYILCKVIDNPGRKILILTNEKKHVNILMNLITPHRPVSKICGAVRTYKNAPVLVGTVSKIGTGFDEENFCDDFDGDPLNLLIMCVSYRNKATIEQNIGRVFRSERPHVIYLLDQDGLCEDHCDIFKAWARRCGGTITETVLNKKALEERMTGPRVIIEDRNTVFT